MESIGEGDVGDEVEVDACVEYIRLIRVLVSRNGLSVVVLVCLVSIPFVLVRAYVRAV